MEKIFLQKTEYEEVEIELPFYSYLQEEDYEIYVKIDDVNFSQIIFSNTGKVEFSKYKHHKIISSYWSSNKTTEKVWKTAISILKKSINNFL